MSFWDTQTTQTKPKSNFWGSSVQPKPEPVLAKPKLLQYQQEAQQAQQVAQKENSFWNITKNTLKGIPKAAAGVAADIVRAPARGVLSTALTIAPKSVQQQIGQINPEEDFGKVGKYALGDQPIQTISGTGKSTLQSFGVQNEGVLNRLATPVGIGLTALDVYPGGQGKKGAKGLLNVAKESVEKVAKQIPENDLKFLSKFASKIKTKEVIQPADSKLARAIFKENGYEVPKTDRQLADLITMSNESKVSRAFDQETAPKVRKTIGDLIQKEKPTFIQDKVTGKMKGKGLLQRAREYYNELPNKQGGYVKNPLGDESVNKAKGVVKGDPIQTLKNVEARVGVKPADKPHLKFDENGRKLAYTPKEKAIINRSEYDEGWFGRKKTELPEEIQKKEYQLQLEKEALAENPAAKLSKYVAKTGEFKGGLKEVTGTGKSAFGRKGDDIVTELGFKDSEEARVAYDNFVAKKENIKAMEQSLKEEIANFKAKPKDPILPKPSASPRVGSDGDLRSLEQVAQEAQARGTGNSGVKLPSLPQIISKTPTPVSKKVGIIDYIRTPDRVLNKIGLSKEMEIVRKGYDGYLEELPKNIDKITEWSKQVPKESSERIFKWLDGQAIDLRPEETKVANEVKTWLSQWADRLGLPKDKQISNYITHLFDDQLIKKEFDEDLAKIIADKVPGSVYDPFLLQRLGAKGYKQDVWAALDAYVKRGTRKVHMDPALSHLEEAAGSLEKSAWDYVKNYADRINMRPSDWDTRFDNSFKQMFGYRAGQRPLANISRNLRQVTFRGMLGGNIGSAMRNISQGVNTYSKLGEKYTAKGYMDLITKGTKELKQVGVLQDNIVQDRVLSATKKTMERIDKGLFFFFDTAEKINRGAAYYGAKAKALSQGKTEAEAIEVAKKLVRDTQFLYSSIDTPLGMQGDIAKVLTQFMSYPVKQTEFLVEMAKNKEFAGLARYALGGLAFTYTIGQAFNMDPQEFIPWSGYLTGDQKFGAPPSLKFPYEAVKAGFDAPDKFGNQRTLGEKASDVGKASLGWIPAGSQIKKTFEGVRAFNQGAGTSATGRVRYPIEQTLTNRLKTGLFGQYSTPEAEQYFDKEQTPLSEKQSQEVLNSANPKEAFDQIKQIQAENKAKEIKNAEHKAKIQPVFDQALSLVKAGDTAGAEQLVNDLSEEDFEVYKGIRSSWRASNTSKARDLLGINNPVEAVKFLRSLPESENARIVDLLTDEEYQLLLEGKEQQ